MRIRSRPKPCLEMNLISWRRNDSEAKAQVTHLSCLPQDITHPIHSANAVHCSGMLRRDGTGGSTGALQVLFCINRSAGGCGRIFRVPQSHQQAFDHPRPGADRSDNGAVPPLGRGGVPVAAPRNVVDNGIICCRRNSPRACGARTRSGERCGMKRKDTCSSISGSFRPASGPIPWGDIPSRETIHRLVKLSGMSDY